MIPRRLFSFTSALRRQDPHRLSLEAITGKLLEGGYRLFLASNRGPVEYSRAADGSLEPCRGSGGVVTALTAVAKSVPMTWISCPLGNGDREVASLGKDGCFPSSIVGDETTSRFICVSKEAYDRYYNVFANPLLWFLQHYMWDLPHSPHINAATYDAWENGYTVVNRAFAEAIVHEVAGERTRPVVLFQDYHLYLAPGYVRQMLPDALLQHFIHIPWPAPRYWLLLPKMMRLAIMQHLCANDIVGFQTQRDVQNFLYTCEAYLEGAKVDFHRQTVDWQNRRVLVRAYPISIDVHEVEQLAASEEAQNSMEKLQPLKGEYTIVRVDRLEPSKNIVRGFMAYDGLLGRYPELAGKVKFWAFLVPSRTDLRMYQQYEEEVFALVKQINDYHGNDAWRPIEVFHENNYCQALAAMTCYDVLLVNPVTDGMNLVAKEGPTVNTRSGVLVLSESAGAHEQLGRYALSVCPTDVEGTIQALNAALTMSAPERRSRAHNLREAVAREDITSWVTRQLEDILALR